MTPTAKRQTARTAIESAKRRQECRGGERPDQPRQDPRAAAVEDVPGQKHRGHRADRDEQQRDAELALRRPDSGLDRRHERRPAAPEDAEDEERRERPAPPHTRSQPSGSCGIGQAGSGRQSSQPVGNGHSSRTRARLRPDGLRVDAARARRPARARPRPSTRTEPSGLTIRSSFSSKVSKPIGVRRSGSLEVDVPVLEHRRPARRRRSSGPAGPREADRRPASGSRRLELPVAAGIRMRVPCVDRQEGRGPTAASRARSAPSRVLDDAAGLRTPDPAAMHVAPDCVGTLLCRPCPTRPTSPSSSRS